MPRSLPTLPHRRTPSGVIESRYAPEAKISPCSSQAATKTRPLALVSLSRKLFAALPEPKEAHYIPNAGHNDLFEPHIIIEFVDKHACR